MTIMMLIESSVHHIASNDGALFSSPPAGGDSEFILKDKSLYSYFSKSSRLIMGWDKW